MDLRPINAPLGIPIKVSEGDALKVAFQSKVTHQILTTVWYVVAPGTPPTSKSTGPTSTSKSVTSASKSTTKSTASSTPTGTGKAAYQLKWRSSNTLCATVQGTPADEALVALANCATSKSDPNYALQSFYYSQVGPIQLANTNFCFDAGQSIIS